MTLLSAPAQRSAPATGRPAVPGPAVVTVRDLSVAYGENAVLSGVDLDLSGGEVVSLLGASGSGKSTLMKSLTGFAPITGGSAVVDGRELHGVRRRELRAVRAGVGQVFQQFHLIPRLSVLTNVLAGCLHRTGAASALGHFPAQERRRALELLERVGIAHKANDPARSLSGGQQQRVAIARALMQQPRVILADEPVASLDPRLADSVLGLLRDIAVSDGIPVLVSLHVVDLALVHSDRVVGLRDGRVLLSGRPGDIGADRLHELYADEEEPDVADL